jgi:prepilin-type processing-associated H-X9-DG protein
MESNDAIVKAFLTDWAIDKTFEKNHAGGLNALYGDGQIVFVKTKPYLTAYAAPSGTDPTSSEQTLQNFFDTLNKANQ